MTEDDFLRAVRADPAGDGPRLVFADWLDEHGDPRGELMRVQVALASLSLNDPRRPPLQEREFELLECHRGRAVGPLSDYCAHVQFVGGRLHVLAWSERWLALGREVGAASPWYRWVERLDLRDLRDDHLARLGEAPVFPNLAAVGLRAGPEGVVGLFTTSPSWEGIRDLDVRACGLDVRALERLLGLPHPRHFVSLDLSGNPLGDAGARVLASSYPGSGLAVCDLGHNQISDEGAVALAESAALPRTTLLILTGNPIGRRGLDSLRASGRPCRF